MRSVPARQALSAAVLVWMASCGDEETTRASAAGASSDAAAPSLCAPGEVHLDDGRCIAAGQQPDGCAAGEAMRDASCVPAGIAADACGRGFEPTGNGACAAVLPDAPCAAGTMAIPGETACHSVAPCGEGTWGDIPVDSTTAFVDGSYGGLDSDGSAARPWKSIQEGVDAASPGAIVAIAAGTYVEDVDVSAEVTVWGRCPSLVEIAGTGDAVAAMTLRVGADGAALRGLGVSGSSAGVLVTGASDVVLDALWVHDTLSRGINAQATLGATAVSISRSLVESTRAIGVYASEAELTLQESVVRGTKPVSGHGRGVTVQNNLELATGATLRSVVLEDNHDAGLFAGSARVTVRESIIRDTLPSDGQYGTAVWLEDVEAKGRPAVTVESSVLERNHEGAACFGGDLGIERTVIRDTSTPPGAEQTFAVELRYRSDIGERASLVMRESVVERSDGEGIYLEGCDGTIESVLVRDTFPTATNDAGTGIVAIDDRDTGERSRLDVRGSIVERSRRTGIAAYGSDATIEGTLVRDAVSLPDAQAGVVISDDPDYAQAGEAALRWVVIADGLGFGAVVQGSTASFDGVLVRDTRPLENGKLGRGLFIQRNPISNALSAVAVRSSVIDGSYEIGVHVVDAEATIEATLVRNTKASQAGTLGDAISVVSELIVGRAIIEGARIETSARAGVSSFGAFVALESTTFSCNAIHLDGEPGIGGQSPQFENGGDNACGCSGEAVTCATMSSTLEPPEAAPTPPKP